MVGVVPWNRRETGGGLAFNCCKPPKKPPTTTRGFPRARVKRGLPRCSSAWDQQRDRYFPGVFRDRPHYERPVTFNKMAETAMFNWMPTAED
jgi:hypothetical protein